MSNVILIISHKRPQCRTVKAIKDAGYNGDWFIVADDLDDTNYEELYPDHVVRFDKMAYAEKVDTADNFGKLTTPVYARNACFDIAKGMGYDCFALLDDDLTGFVYRYQKGSSLLSKNIDNLDAVFYAYCDFILSAKVACCGFIPSGRLIGGVGNNIVRERIYYNPTNAYIINTHVDQIPFVGTLWEDSIYCYLNNMTGRIVIAAMPIVMSMESPGSMKDGGNKELYQAGNAYIAESYGNMVIPSFFRWTNGISGHKFRQDLPRTLNERWRKNA